MERDKITVGLLIGGISEERPISLETGKSVFSALKELGYSVKVIDPALGKHQNSNIEEILKNKTFTGNDDDFIESFNPVVFDGVDVVYNAMHGPYAEDGITQVLLDLLEIEYIGADARASFIGMDKWISKILFDKAGVQVPKGFFVNEKSVNITEVIKKVKSKISVPFIVKPNNQGSTIGLTLCKDINNLNSALEKAFAVTDKVLIEEYISGGEFTVAVIFGEAMPVLEIIPNTGLYDFTAKYQSDETVFVVPAEIDEKLFSEMQELALSAFDSIGCRDFARVDFKLSPDNEIYCLEINTLPGMTSHSLVPKMAAAAGISFNELIDKLIINAVSR